MKLKTIDWEIFCVKARRILNLSWKVALVLIGIFCGIVILVAVRVQYDNHYGSSAHYHDMLLSENICVHHFCDGIVRVYNLKTEEYVTPRLKWVSEAPDRDSLAVFCDRDNKRGFLNVNTGEIVIEGRYEHAWVFSEGLAAVVETGGKMGFIDKTGNYVIAPELDYFYSHDYVFKHDVCCIENSDGYQGLLSRDGAWVLPQEYSFIRYISETDMFIPIKDGKAGLIRNGSFEWVYPMEYEDIFWIESPTGNGFVLYRDFCSKHVSVDGKVIDAFLVDGTEELKYKIQCNGPDTEDEYAISDKVIAFRVYGLYGVMDKRTGKILVPAKYGEVEMASADILKCGLERYGSEDYVLFDLKGNKIEKEKENTI